MSGDFVDDQIGADDFADELAAGSGGAHGLEIEMDDFDDVPFNQKGGRLKVYELFGDELNGVMQELTEALVA